MKIYILCKTWCLSTGHKGGSMFLVLPSDIISPLTHCVWNLLELLLMVWVLDWIQEAHYRKYIYFLKLWRLDRPGHNYHLGKKQAMLRKLETKKTSTAIQSYSFILVFFYQKRLKKKKKDDSSLCIDGKLFQSGLHPYTQSALLQGKSNIARLRDLWRSLERVGCLNRTPGWVCLETKQVFTVEKKFPENLKSLILKVKNCCYP